MVLAAEVWPPGNVAGQALRPGGGIGYRSNALPVACGVACVGAAENLGELSTQRFCSKRRQKSEAHLQQVLHELSDHLHGSSVDKEAESGLLSFDGAKKSFEAAGAGGKGAANRRAVKSLRMPRPEAVAVATSPKSKALTPSPSEASMSTCAGGGFIQRDDAASPEVALCDRDLLAQLEDVRLQNAILRKSLATLQQSVVESMKGNRAGFVGNGFFKQAAAGGRVRSSTPCQFGSSQQLSSGDDLEDLRVSLAEQRASLRAMEAALEEAIQRAEAAEETLRRERDVFELELKSRAEALDEAVKAHASADSLASIAKERAEEMRIDMERMRLDIEAARQASIAAEEQVRELSYQLGSFEDALHAAETELAKVVGEKTALEDDRVRLLAVSDGGLTKIARLRQELQARGAAAIWFRLGIGGYLQCCFSAWSDFRVLEREARFSGRASVLEADVARLVGNLAAAGKESERLSAAADAAFLDVMAAQERLGIAEETSETLREQAESAMARAQNAEGRLQAVEAEILDLRTRLKKYIASSEGNEASAKRLSRLEKELEVLRREASEAATAAKVAEEARAIAEEARRTSEAEARTASEAAARRVIEAEALCKAAREELAKAKAESYHKGLEAAKANKRADEADAIARALKEEINAARQKVIESAAFAKTLQQKVDELQRRICDLEGEVTQKTKELSISSAARDAAEKESLRAAQAEAQLASLRADGNNSSQKNLALSAELSTMKLDLAEARSSVKVEKERTRLQAEKLADLAWRLEEARSAQSNAEARAKAIEDKTAAYFKQADEAIEEARKHVRIMVTAPKVAINIGGNEYKVAASFPFAAIKTMVQDEIIPQFSKAVVVAEGLGDQELKIKAQGMVQEMAITLQTKVHELMPAAEGTCNWDGFGAKCGAMNAAR